MAGPLLLVHEDSSAIAIALRILLRQSDPVLVATTADEAIGILGQSAPGLLLLSPLLGAPVLAALTGKAIPVLLLGAPIPGFSHPVVAFPPDKEFLATVLERVRSADAVAGEGLLELAQSALTRAREDAAAAQRAIVAEVEQLRKQALVDTEQLQREHEAREAAAAEGARLGGRLDDVDRALAQSLSSDAEARAELARLSVEHRILLSRRDALETDLADERERALQRAEQSAALELQRGERQRSLQLELDASRDAGGRLQKELELEKFERAAERANATARSDALAAELSTLRAELEVSAGAVDRQRKALERSKAERAAEQAGTKSRTDAQIWTLQNELSTVKEASDRLRRDLELARADHSNATAGSEVLSARISTLQAELGHAEEQLDAERATAAASLDTLRTRLEAEISARSAERIRAEQHRLEQLARFTALESQLVEAGQRLSAEAANAALALESAKAEVAAGEDLAHAQRLEHRGRVSALEQQLAEARQQLLDDAATASAALTAARDALHATRSGRSAERARAQAESTELLARLARLEQQLTQERVAAASALEALSAQHAADQLRARNAEKLATEVQERLREVETRAAVELKIEDAQVIIARTGRLGLRELALLVMQLVRGRADVWLELTTSRGMRSLRLHQGALVAAESTLKSESLSERARRDGLIDAVQNAQVHALGEVPGWQLLDELLQRKLIRRTEVAGLLRRSAEEVTLEALCEPECSYRLRTPRGLEMQVDPSIRPLPVLLGSALRRAFSSESHLELLGGSQAVARRDAAVDARPFGFSPAERGLLEAADGVATIEQLIARSQVKPEGAHRVLSAAKLLGLIEVSVPRRASLSPTEREQLLEAKYEQVRQADYFTILGLSRTTDAAEVKRAHRVLFEQFEPLRDDAELDAATHHRAKIVLAALEEAAHTLRDDRLRIAYARHLRD